MGTKEAIAKIYCYEGADEGGTLVYNFERDEYSIICHKDTVKQSVIKAKAEIKKREGQYNGKHKTEDK